MHDPLNSETRELVGIAASIAGHCQPCFAYHYAKALELGVPAEAIREAMHLARAVRASGDCEMDESAASQMASGGLRPGGPSELDLPKL